MGLLKLDIQSNATKTVLFLYLYSAGGIQQNPANGAHLQGISHWLL